MPLCNTTRWGFTLTLYCEMCGRPVTGAQYRITIEGVNMIVCSRCYNRYMERVKRTGLDVPLRVKAVQSFQRLEEIRKQVVEPMPRISTPRSKPPTRKPTSIATSTRRVQRTSLGVYEKFEVVPDFAERVKRARERLGWTQRMLAQKVKVGENVIRRIEAGTLVPSIDLAKRLEQVLGIKLLEPVIEEEEVSETKRAKSSFYLTLGDIAEIKED